MIAENAFMTILTRYKIYRTNFSLAIIVCLVMIAYLIGMGVSLLSLGQDLFVFTAPISQDCPNGTCTFTFRAKKTLQLPVIAYIGFEGFHYNHRKVMQSINFEQISPDEETADRAQGCNGYNTNADAARFLPRLFGRLPPEDELKPCGLRALLFQNREISRHRRGCRCGWSPGGRWPHAKQIHRQDAGEPLWRARRRLVD